MLAPLLAASAALVLPEAPGIIRKCVPLLPGGPSSCTVGNPEDECSLTRLATGNTNRLYCLSRERGDRFLVREFGTESALPFDRVAENAAFAQLSEAGLAPPLLATFNGGRIEGWLEGGPVDVEACRSPAVYEQVARALAALHAFELERPPAAAYRRPAGDVPWGWQAALSWLPVAMEHRREVARGAKAAQYARRVEALELAGVGERLEDLMATLDERDPPRCFCHNDLSNTNLHLDPGTGLVRLIDFEYGGLNFRGFDLATHLTHWAGGAEDGLYDDDNFPSDELMRRFLSAYAAAAADAPTVDALVEEVRLCAPLAHCVWGLWAVCSLPDEEGGTPFSHIEYAERRLGAFESLMTDL